MSRARGNTNVSTIEKPHEDILFIPYNIQLNVGILWYDSAALLSTLDRATHLSVRHIIKVSRRRTPTYNTNPRKSDKPTQHSLETFRLIKHGNLKTHSVVLSVITPAPKGVHLQALLRIWEREEGTMPSSERSLCGDWLLNNRMCCGTTSHNKPLVQILLE